MSSLREAAERIAHMGRFATPFLERRIECEKAAARLAARDAGSARAKEPWHDFLRRIGAIDG